MFCGNPFVCLSGCIFKKLWVSKYLEPLHWTAVTGISQQLYWCALTNPQHDKSKDKIFEYAHYMIYIGCVNFLCRLDISD